MAEAAKTDKALKSFTVEELCDWVRTVYRLPNVEDCISAIRDNYVDGITFLHLDAELVSRLNFNPFHAPRILHLARNCSKHNFSDMEHKVDIETEEIEISEKKEADCAPIVDVPTPSIKQKFPFPSLKCQKCREIPVITWDDTKKIFEYLEKQQPVVIKKSRLTGDCSDKWTVDYLKEKIHGNCTVYSADSMWFRYWNDEKNFGAYPFEHPTQSNDLTFQEFLKRVDEANEHNEGSAQKKYLYMQHSLGKGCEELSEDFANWEWDFLHGIIERCGWVNLTANLLLVGMKGVLTPLHFDEQENLFCQLKGNKEVVLFPPSNFENLYPFPQGHPCDRQSMIDIDNPDMSQFPKFKDATPYCAILEPGDCLYLPFMWWHQFRNLEDLATSVTFWCITKPSDAAEVLKTGVLSDTAKVAVRRNIEKLAADRSGGWNKLNDAFVDIMKGTPSGKALKQYLVDILSHLQIPHETRVEFIDDLIVGRYGVPHETFVKPNGHESSKPVSV